MLIVSIPSCTDNTVLAVIKKGNFLYEEGSVFFLINETKSTVPGTYNKTPYNRVQTTACELEVLILAI
jgi:hypothetical protein